MKTLCLSLSALLLVACAGRENPIALERVENPMMVGADGKPMTLYSSVVTQGVPTKVAQAAFIKYDQFAPFVRNPAYIVMIDFTQHSGQRRFFMVNRQSGVVDQWVVAHGSGSDPNDDGYADYFSNVPDSHMSSLGAYLIQEKYASDRFGESLRLDGLEETNSNVRDRAIVLHPSHSVDDGNGKQGRSWGCPAIPYEWIQTVIARSENGGFMYAYGVNKGSKAEELRALQQWNLIPKSQWTNESEDAIWE